MAFSSLTSMQSSATDASVLQRLPKEALLEDDGRYSEYLCTYCQLLLFEPVQHSCGHRFCKECLQECIEKSMAAPKRWLCMGCQLEDDIGDYSVIGENIHYADQAIRREMRKLEIRCQYNSQGCPWRGLFQNYTTHVELCDFALVPCSECQELVVKREHCAHLKNSCPRRLVSCTFCSKQLAAVAMPSHTNQCLLRPDSCLWNSVVSTWKKDHPDWWISHDINEEDESTPCPLGCQSNKATEMFLKTSLARVVTSEGDVVDPHIFSTTGLHAGLEGLLEHIEMLSSGDLALGQGCQSHAPLSRFSLQTVIAVRALQRDGSQCSEAGCSDTVNEIKLHKELLLSCALNKDGQPCTWRANYKQFAEHLADEHTCAYCDEHMSNASVAFKHSCKCSKWPVLCLWCNTRVASNKITEHQSSEGDCPWVLCTFGCHTLVRRDNFEDHVHETIASHLIRTNSQLHRVAFKTSDLCKDLLSPDKKKPGQCDSATKISTPEAVRSSLKAKGDAAQSKEVAHQSELEETLAQVEQSQSGMQKDVRVHASRVETLESTLQGLSQNITNLTSRIKTVSSGKGTVRGNSGPLVDNAVEFLDTIHRYTTVLSRDVKCLTQQVQDIDSLRRKLVTQERLLLLKDVVIAELNSRVETLEQTSTDGTLLWRVGNFSRRLEEAKDGSVTSLFSPTFLSHPKGYKMCARLYPNGDGSGKGSHISLFFVIKRSVNDPFLQWPFRRRVKLMILDPSSDRRHHSDSFRPEPSSSSFEKPKTDMNVASGCPQFLPLSKLSDFKQNDCIYIYVQVHAPDREEKNPF